MENQLTEVARVSLDAAKLQNPTLTLKRRRELRIELLKTYIRSQPAGSRITGKQFMKALHFATQPSCWAFVDACVKKKIISKEPITPRTFSFTVLGDAKTVKMPVGTRDITGMVAMSDSVFDVEKVPEPMLGYREYTISQLEELAGRFMYHYDSANIKDFIKWLNSQEN